MSAPVFYHRFVQKIDSDVCLVWGHGWGQSSHAFLPWTESLESLATHLLIDFPGFGKSPLPSDTWGTKDYADATASFLRKETPGMQRIWVGHSFGGRIGIQIAARHPDLLSGLFLIAPAGLKRKRTLPEMLRFQSRTLVYKSARRLGFDAEMLKNSFGSPDYNAAGPLRNVLVRVIHEDLSSLAKEVRCPVKLFYGMDDTETPPSMGREFAALFPDAFLTLLKGHDHNSLVQEGRYVLLKYLRHFMDSLACK